MSTKARQWVACRLRRIAWRLSPIPRSWSSEGWAPGADGYEQAYLELETDGFYTGTTLTVNGKPVHNCVGVSFEIKVGELARATIEVEDIPIRFKGHLTPEEATA